MGKYMRGRKPRRLVSVEKALKDLQEFIDSDDGLSSAADGNFTRWAQWAAARDHPAMPAHPAHLVGFFQNLGRRGLVIATIETYAASIAQCHRAQGLPDPVTPDVRKQLSNLKRKLGSSTKRKLEKLTSKDLALIRETANRPRPGESGAEARSGRT